jgi:hypothetical protein
MEPDHRSPNGTAKLRRQSSGVPDTYAGFAEWKAKFPHAEAIALLGARKPDLMDAVLRSCWSASAASALQGFRAALSSEPR